MSVVSKVGICNIALAMLGAAPIKNFNENKRGRQCEVFYHSTVAYLIEQYDWTFARKYVSLNQVVLTDDVPEGLYTYQLPADCLIPRELSPRGSRNFWEIAGDVLYCKQEIANLYYTRNDFDVARFSRTFENLAAAGIASKLAPSISQDVKLAATLFEQFLAQQREAWATDANIGNVYRGHDETPENDTFVNPDLAGWLEIDAYTPS